MKMSIALIVAAGLATGASAQVITGYDISDAGETGAGIGELLDAVLGFLPDRTATETNAVEIEDVPEDGSGDWSPI